MFKQNYINIFENVAGNITIAYTSCANNDQLQVAQVESIAIEKADLKAIGEELIRLSYSIKHEG